MIASIVDLAIKTLEALIIIRILLSWFQFGGRQNEFARFIYDITEPILAPFRFILPLGRMGGIDLSPIIVFFVLDFLRTFILRML